MANFERRSGEQIVFDQEVKAVDGNKEVPGRLILTNERLVLCVANKMGLAEVLLGRFGGMLRTVNALTASRITHEIARERFASVERGDGKLIVFRDVGEGYAHTSFAVVSDMFATPNGFAMLQQRIDSWAGR